MADFGTAATVMSEDEFEQLVYNIGSAIPLRAFQIVTGIVFALAIISALARSVMRILTRRPLYWDDFFLALGVICFITVTTILYKNTWFYYLSSALQLYPSLAFKMDASALPYLLSSALPQLSATAACAWTTIFCVKASFLIVSKQLIARLPFLNAYFWVVVVFTACSWVICVSAPWIECPFSGYDTLQCQGAGRNTIYVAMNAVIAALDIITDLLVASIPIAILWKSKLKVEQKLVVGPFLCLSLVMIIFAIIRVSKIHTATIVDIVWLAFWQYLEAGIAIIVTSFATLRTVFTAQKQKTKESNRSRSWFSSRTKSKDGGGTVPCNSVDESHPMVQKPDLEKALPATPSRIRVSETWAVSYNDEDTIRYSGGQGDKSHSP